MSGCVLRKSFEDSLTKMFWCCGRPGRMFLHIPLCAKHRYVTLHGAILSLTWNGGLHFSLAFTGCWYLPLALDTCPNRTWMYTEQSPFRSILRYPLRSLFKFTLIALLKSSWKYPFDRQTVIIIKRKALKSCLCVCPGIPSTGCVKYLYVHREGVNPSSMEGVLDLSDHISVFSFQ